MAWADKGVSLKTRAHQDKLGRMTDDSPASSQGVSHEDAPGLGISAFISVGLFALPWLLALLVGVWADLQPANDIVVELYEPLEAVYLQLDPPADEESELEVAEDGLVADEEIDGDPDLVADTEPEPPSEDLPDEDPGGSKGGEGDAGVEDPEADGSAGEGGTDEGDGEGDGEGEAVELVEGGASHLPEALAGPAGELGEPAAASLGHEGVVHEGGLAGARGADDGGPRAGNEVQVEVLQVVVAGAAEPDHGAPVTARGDRP